MNHWANWTTIAIGATACALFGLAYVLPNAHLQRTVAGYLLAGAVLAAASIIGAILAMVWTFMLATIITQL